MAIQSVPRGLELGSYEVPKPPPSTRRVLMHEPVAEPMHVQRVQGHACIGRGQGRSQGGGQVGDHGGRSHGGRSQDGGGSGGGEGGGRRASGVHARRRGGSDLARASETFTLSTHTEEREGTPDLGDLPMLSSRPGTAMQSTRPENMQPTVVVDQREPLAKNSNCALM